MKTEENVREERRKIFYKLYSLPWIILTIVLIGIVIVLGIMVMTKDGSSREIKPRTEWVSNENTNNSNCIEEGKKIVYKEAIEKGYGEWKLNNEGKIGFIWYEPDTNDINTLNTTTESIAQEDIDIIIKRKIEEKEENIRKKAYTECARGIYIEAVSNGMGRWIADVRGNVEFGWKSVGELVREYTSTESGAGNNRYMVNREANFNLENYQYSKKIGIDLEGNIVKGCMLSIEGNFFNRRDNEFKEKVKGDIAKVVHDNFSGFEALNVIDKKLERR